MRAWIVQHTPIPYLTLRHIPAWRSTEGYWGSQQVNLFEGAKYDGVFGMWYGKGPGVDRSMDVFKHANAFGTSKHGGVLAIAGDDHACVSSTLPHQSEHNFIGASIPVLNPGNAQEVLDYGIIGWHKPASGHVWLVPVSWS